MVRASCLLTCCLLATLLLIMPAASYPSMANYRDDNSYEPEEILEMLARLNNLIQIERKMQNYKEDVIDKRALDFGLNRGYSGAIQAKHLMGIAAANSAGGPGRRRRGVN